MPEYFDLFDSDNQPLFAAKERSLVHQDGDWHRTSQIWIMNEKKEILCNLRSPLKDVFADFWDLSVGGHVSTGDDYDGTALRELEEELGISAKPEELIFLGYEKIDGGDVEKSLLDREHAKLFLYKTTRKVYEFKPQEEEIQKLSYFSIGHLKRVIETKDPSMKIIPVKSFYLKILKKLEEL